MQFMNLKSYYQSLPEPIAPKSDFIRKISRLCNVGEPTVRLWVTGKTKPANESHIDILVDETGIKKEELFV